MLVEVKTHKNWHCLCNQGQLNWVSQLPEIPELLAQFNKFETTLKDNHRSFVVKGSLNQKTVIAKQPRDKNKRIWSRVLSYMEPSEVAQTLISLERFREQGIESLQALFVLEKRVLGAVVDSWICYEYREGKASEKQHLDRIIDLLHKLHRAGFRHNDPNLGNFMLDENDTMFLIDCRGRKRSGNFSDANDFFLLKKINKTLDNFDIKSIAGLNKASLGYRLALIYNKAKLARSYIKERIRKNRPKNTES